ncbi:MAG: glycosyltransferase family 4 protein [Salinibacter sp.]|uniref:glycosyltransferase family 4 protein n=1 Tax=Salinibacter sp. TaxID=2065818 RepID=UPI0035D4634A
MEIGIVTNEIGPGSGQGRVNYEVAQAACERGHHVVLLSSEVDPQLAAARNATWIQISAENWPTRLLKDQVFAWRSARWLEANASRLDVVLGNGCNTWFSPDFNAAHFVHSAWKESPVHTSQVQTGPYAWYQWLYTTVNAYWEKRAFREAGTVIAVSEQVRNELVDAGIRRDAIRVVHNGVDTSEFKPGPAERADLGLPENVPLALFVGEIRTPRKNLDTVLEALDSVPTLHLAVAGRRAESPYPDMARRLGLSDRVHFLGFRKDVPDLMRAADLFVFPSRYEACSLVLLEAMASGLPIVTAQTAGGAELVEDCFGRVLPDPNDEQALAQALDSLIGDPEQLEDMGRAARSAATHHTWSNMANEYLALFEQEDSRS